MPPRPQFIPTDLVARAFSTDEAARAGVSKRRLQGQQIRSLGRSLHCDASTPVSWEAKVRGWMSTFPDQAALYGRSAARWWGVPMPDDSAVVHIVVPRGDTKPRERPGLRPHPDTMRDEVMRDHGWEIIRVTAAQLRRPWQLCELIRRRMHVQAQRLGLVLDPVSLTVVG